MSKIYSYVVEHDHGFAPNPFWGVCTLANCKPLIRKYAVIGDRVIGTGSSKNGLQDFLIYWMIVDEIISFDQYWHDSKYSVKKPAMNGSTAQNYGDNIYYSNNMGEFVQADSFHSEKNGVLSEKNRTRDTARTDRVLIGKRFSYLGKNAVKIPDDLRVFVKRGPSHKCRFSPVQIKLMDKWLASVANEGILGDPVKW